MGCVFDSIFSPIYLLFLCGNRTKCSAVKEHIMPTQRIKTLQPTKATKAVTHTMVWSVVVFKGVCVLLRQAIVN